MVQPILEKMHCIPEGSVVQTHCPGPTKIPLVVQAVSTKMIPSTFMRKGLTTFIAQWALNIVNPGQTVRTDSCFIIRT
jgi:hypothetical protein